MDVLAIALISLIGKDYCEDTGRGARARMFNVMLWLALIVMITGLLADVLGFIAEHIH